MFNVTVPQQSNAVDCGLYMLKTLEIFSQNLPLTTPEDGWDSSILLQVHVPLCNSLDFILAINSVFTIFILLLDEIDSLVYTKRGITHA